MTRTWEKPNLFELSAKEAGFTITDQASLYIVKDQIHIVVNERVVFDAIPAEAQKGMGWSARVANGGAIG